MGKKLAIRGHSTRGKEVIELLEMMGGINKNMLSAHIGDVLNPHVYFIEPDFSDNRIVWDYLLGLEWDGRASDMMIFTLQEFLEKFPYKVGDVIKFPNNMAEEIAEMKWDEDLKDIIYTSVSGCTRPSRVPKNTNKTNMKTDCKKCGLHFGSIRCFDKDCPHNTPKSYAVGLKDGEIIECGVNKEIVMNENKPLFKTGDVVKLKGCPVKNLFWIVVDVVEDGYIFNDGKKYSFDDQHHYEKTNREIINIQPNITAEVTDKNNCNIECPYGYEFYDENGNIIGTKVLMRPKKPIYPTTYEECYDESNTELHFIYVDKNERDLYESFIQLIRCRNAYWKIAGDEMGLDKPWEPDLENEELYCIQNYNKQITISRTNTAFNKILIFPFEEMRDAFYENFKDLIEQCKELL